MIEPQNDQLVFGFPDVPDSAVFTINFQRTLRMPDDDKEYPCYRNELYSVSGCNPRRFLERF